jgi:predicted Rossmann fold flavoprotein
MDRVGYGTRFHSRQDVGAGKLKLTYSTIIIGAGAAGMMCAVQAGSQGGKVLIVEHTSAAGEKIRISGGGRCNFTNLHCGPKNFISANPHFAKSVLASFSPQDFIALVDKHGIAWHEKTLGQLFCDGSAKQIVAMLLDEMERFSVAMRLGTAIERIAKTASGFDISLSDGTKANCDNMVVACGGKSIPKMGATGFGYQVAAQFGHVVTDTRPALVPFTFGEDLLTETRELAGIACDARVSCNGAAFDEAILLTHRGISGPAVLQISSYWREKTAVRFALLPKLDLLTELKAARIENGRRDIGNVLPQFLPKRLSEYFLNVEKLGGNIADFSDLKLAKLVGAITNWQVTPTGTEGYRTAEVTLGGVETDGLNARTMESKSVPGLYFIGEIVDVTGWLGGFNFQWAWASGFAAGRAIAEKI